MRYFRGEKILVNMSFHYFSVFQSKEEELQRVKLLLYFSFRFLFGFWFVFLGKEMGRIGLEKRIEIDNRARKSSSNSQGLDIALIKA